MLQLPMLRVCSCGKAVGVLHSGGKEPDRWLISRAPAPISKAIRDGNEGPSPHEGGRVPVM